MASANIRYPAPFGDLPLLAYISLQRGKKGMKTFKCRIEPNAVQKDAIDHMIDANRLVYNNMITASRIQYGKDRTLPTVFDLNKLATRMRHNNPYVAEAYSMTLNETSKRVFQACKKTLGEHKKEAEEFFLDTMRYVTHDRFPRYKSAVQFNSYSYPTDRDYSVVTRKDDSGKKRRFLRLGKVPDLIRCYNQSTKVKGELKTCTIKRKDMGSYCLYYACISYEPEPEPPKEPMNGPVGIDVGVSNIVALSDGNIVGNDHIFHQFLQQLKSLQQRLSRLSPCTKAYGKMQTRVNHLYGKIHNHRRNIVETVSAMLVNNYQAIAMEDLSVMQIRSISKSRKMTNGYNDASLGILRRRILDKASSAGRGIVLVDPKGTSQSCSVCGKTVKKDLSVRVHECPYCGITMDRDVNAARNILFRSGLVPAPWVDRPPSSRA